MKADFSKASFKQGALKSNFIQNARLNLTFSNGGCKPSEKNSNFKIEIILKNTDFLIS